LFWFFYLISSFPSGKQGRRLKGLAVLALAVGRKEGAWLGSVTKPGRRSRGGAEGRLGRRAATDTSTNVCEGTEVV